MKHLKSILTTVALAATTLSAIAQGDYASILKLRSLNKGVGEVRTLADPELYTSLSSGRIVKSSYADPKFEEVIYEAPMGDFAISDYALSPNEEMILISQGAEPIYRHSFTTHYHLKGAKGTEAIIHNFDATRDASFAPNSQKIAFSSLNNLYLYDIATKKTAQITSDGEWNSIINGTTDWVYEEELGFTRAYWFSPNSQEIAYLKFDESEVPLFEMMRYDNTLYNKSYSFKYPKAGDSNAVVELWVYNIAEGKSRQVDTGEEKDQYISYVGYTPAGSLYFYRLNRLQNRFEVVLVDADGSQQVIYEEKSPRYVERTNSQNITFIDEDKFIVKEETSTGYMHLYLHSISEGRLHAITKGDWEVTQLLAVDGKRLYYVSTEGNHLQRAIYSIGVNGRGKRLLSKEKGYYMVRPTKTMEYFIASYTTASQPAQTAIYNNKGEMVRMLEDNHELKEALKADNRPVKEFFEIETERGDILSAYMLRPRDFDKSKKYPVLLTQYSGPGSQQVADRWSLDWEDAMVDNGYVIISADGRGTGFRGEEFKKMTYGNLGGLEVEDQISVARYAAALPYVDAARVGIYGWSYGGFMTLNCALKSGDLFRMALAVAPVTSWRYYDTIYTEIYNGLPQDNPSGYDDNSPINFAEGLSDRTNLLIIHGTADDNVHFQNSMEMTRALNAAGKQYDMMVYPDQNHSMLPSCTSNVRQKMIDYTLENL